jgi:hypothetical protein
MGSKLKFEKNKVLFGIVNIGFIHQRHDKYIYDSYVSAIPNMEAGSRKDLISLIKKDPVIKYKLKEV